MKKNMLKVGFVALLGAIGLESNTATAINTSLSEKSPTARTYFAQKTTSYSFASALEELTDEDLEEFSKYEKNMENRENIMSGNFEELKKAEGFESVLDDKQDDLASLEILDNVKKAVDEAKLYHNMKQMLPEYRKTFQSLKEAREYHNKTVEYLQESAECAVSYLTPHYQNPQNVWFGKNCGFFDVGTIYCHYDTEKTLDDSTASKGLYDYICPDDSQHLCFIQKIEENDYTSGISGLLIGYYNQGKIDDALQETQTYLKEGEQTPTETVQKTSDNAYTALVQIESSVEIEDTENDYVVSRDDMAITDTDDPNASSIIPKTSTVMQKQTTSRDDQEVDENLKDPQKAEALAEETRKGHLMNWIWGAQVASDISQDLSKTTSEFGTRIRKFPLWNDQKEFYDQYISGKYDNIKEYVQKAPMPDALITAATAINDVFKYDPIIIKDSSGKEVLKIEPTEISNNIKEALTGIDKTAFNQNDNTKVAVDKIIAKENSDLEALIKNHNKKIASLTSQKEKLQEELGKANTELSTTNEEINKDGEQISLAVNNDRIEAKNKEYSDKLKSKYKTAIDIEDSPINKKFSEEKSANLSAKISAIANRKQKLSLVNSLEKKSQLLATELKKVKDEIEREKRDFIKEYSEKEEDIRTTFDKKVSELQIPTIEDSSVVESMVNAITKAADALSKVYNTKIVLPTNATELAGQMIACLRTEAATIAENTKIKLEGMEENESIYYNETAQNVNGIHTGMINEMKNISKCSIDGVDSSSVAAEVFGKMCNDVDCTNPDLSKDSNGMMNYFVGAVALKDDLKTPTPPLEFSSAPMREIFHLDITDYENIEKYYEDEDVLDTNSNVMISANGFLNSGLEMPVIWKYILKPHSYGHKQFDLTRILGNSEYGDEVRGDPDKNYIRSGSFPCYIDNNVIDVNPVLKLKRTGGKWALSVEKFGYTINMTPDTHIYNKTLCRGFSIKDGKVIDYAVDASPPGNITEASVKGLISETSELGTVLAYIPNEATSQIIGLLKTLGKTKDKNAVKRKLTFNAGLQKAIGLIAATEDLGEDKEQDAIFHLAERSLIERNQFGDYLNQVEQEAIARESLAKVENQIDEITENLKEIFYGTSIIISDNFDLLNVNDYKDAADTLDEQKKIYLNKAQREIQEVKGISQTVKNKADTLLHAIAVLEADSDELVQINGDENISELSAKIKNQQADSAVLRKYEEMGTEAHDRRLRQLQPPYCEVHSYK